MTYSFTQISQYLRCPRQYRYRYLDGWREKEDKASMIFGRCFENALSAYFARKIRPLRSSRNGVNTKTLRLPTRRMIPGIGSITKAFTCSNVLLRMIEFGYDVRSIAFR